MKTLIAILLTATAALAGSVSLEWNPSPDADVTHYRLSWGTGGRWAGSIMLPTTNAAVVPNLPTGRYRFQVQARGYGMWSDPSNWVESNVTNEKVLRLRLIIDRP